MSRETTNKIIDMMDAGAIDPSNVAMMCMSYMSEADVADMARLNELLLEDEDGNTA